MFDTSNPVPRQEGGRSKISREVHDARWWSNVKGGLLLKNAKTRVSAHRKLQKPYQKDTVSEAMKSGFRSQFEQRSSILEFATLDYLRKYLHGEPLLAQKGEPGYDPGIEAEVKAAAAHRPRYSAATEKMIKSQEGKKWRPRKGYKTAPAGKDILADVEGAVPGASAQSIKAGIFKQLKDITTEPPKPEAPPPEMLPDRPVGKTKVRGADYEGRPNIRDLWDPKAAAQPTEVKVTPNLTLRKRPRIPRNEGEREALRRKVSAGAEAFRDPIASHLARVEAGATPNLLQEYKPRIPGVPARRLNPVREAAERHRAQGIRDVLAEKGWAFRKNVLKPLREYRRKQLGLPPVEPIGKETVKRIHESVPARGISEIGEVGKVRRVSPKSTVNIVGAELHPAVLRKLQGQFESDLGKRLAIHQKAAQKIRQDIHTRVHASASPLEHGREIEEAAMEHVKKHFDPGRNEPISPLHARQAAAFTGYKTEEIQKLHKAFRRHTYLGETQKGEDLLRGKVFPRSLRKVSAVPPPAAPVASIIKASPLLRRTGIGLGIAGAVGAGAYLTHKVRQRKRALQEMSARTRLIRFQQLEDVYSPPTPWHRKEARRWLLYPTSRAAALEKTLGRAKRIHGDIRAPKTKTGEIIDERGRVREPEWRKPWFRRTLVTGGIVGAALAGRGVYGKLKRTSEVAAGLMSKKLPISAGERFAVNVTSGNWLRALGKKLPRTSSVLSSASQRASGIGQRFRQETKSLKTNIAERANKAIEGQVGEITGGRLRRNKAGVITKVEWDNPAYLKEHMEKARKIQARGEQIKAQGIEAEKRAARSGATRESLEEALKRREPPEKKLNELLTNIIQFQYPVPVREHYRRPRSSQPKSRQKQLREGLLLGAGGTAALGGTVLGARYGWNRYAQRLTREEVAKQASHEVDQLIRKREAEILGSTARKVVKKTAKIIPHKFSSRLREIQFSAWSNLRDKITGQHQEGTSPVHDIATGAIEGGLAFPASEFAYRKLIGKGAPSTLKKIAVGGAVGGLATGLIGAGLSSLKAGKRKIQARRQARQEWSSKLKEVRFQQPRRNQRMLVAKDRYTKQIKQRDLDLANQHYIHSALLGAGLGALTRKKPASLSKAVLGGALTGIGAQKATRIYGAGQKDPFGERSITAKRVERAPTYAGLALVGYLGLRKSKKLRLSARLREIRFQQEPPRKHNVAAGLLVAAGGLPLYKGAGKFARIGLRPRIDRLIGNKVSHGKQVADYLEATQHVLNRGITGKLAGVALRNPKHPVVKALLPGAKSGIKKLDLAHYSAFRSSPTEALDAWAGEVAASMRPGKAREAHIAHYQKLQGHLQNLWSKGFNEREALRHVATDPVHENFFRRLAAHKAGPTKHYQKITAGLAAIPATAGAAVAATTRKNDVR
jgi:hypothetical protein